MFTDVCSLRKSSLGFFQRRAIQNTNAGPIVLPLMREKLAECDLIVGGATFC